MEKKVFVAGCGVSGIQAARLLEKMGDQVFLYDGDTKKLFSFEVDDEALERLASACEHYIVSKAERRFSTLDYWKSIKI